MRRKYCDLTGEQFSKSRSDLGLHEATLNRYQNVRLARSDSNFSNCRPRCPNETHRYCNQSITDPSRICRMRARFILSPEECLDNSSEASLNASSYLDRLMELSSKGGCDCSDDLSNPSFLYSPSDVVDDDCIEGLSEFLSRTYNELCRRFNNVKDRLYGSPPGRMGPDYRRNVRPQCTDNDDANYLFGPSHAHPNFLNTSAHQQKCQNETYEEVVIEKSKVQNGELAHTKKRIITKIDNCGNMSGKVIDETTCKNDAYNAQSPVSSRANRNAPRRVDFSEKLENECAPCSYVSSCDNITQESMPQYESYPASSASQSNYQRSCTNEQLDDISPAYYPSYPTCCNNETVPSYDAFAGPLNRQHDCPSQMISDISLPTFPDSAQEASYGAPMIRIMPKCQCAQSIEECQSLENVSPPPFISTRENLQDVSAPSYAQSPAESQRKVMFYKTTGLKEGPSYNQSNCENLQNISPPVFDQTSSRQTPTQQRILFREQLPPNNAAAAVNCATQQWQQRSYGQERLQDISAPKFEQSSSRQTTQQRSCQISCPDRSQNYKSQDFYSSECLNDVSMPDLQRSSPKSAPRPPMQQQRSFPRQFIENTSAPTYYSPQSSNCQQSYPNECLDNISAPTFQRSNTYPPSVQRTLPNECLDDVSMPVCDRTPQYASTPNRSPQSSNRQQSYPNECLDNISAPTFQRSNTYPPSVQRTLPNECLDDVSMPVCDRTPQYASIPNRSPQSSNRQQSYPNECLDNISAPTFPRSNTYPPSVQRTLPSECLDDVSMPVCDRTPQYASTPIRSPQSSNRQQSYPNECLDNISAPTFQRSNTYPPSVQRTLPSECLDDVSMPVCDRTPQYASTPIRSPQSSKGQKSYPNECLDNISAPTFQRSNTYPPSVQRTLPSECLDDVSMPVCDRTPQYASTPMRSPESKRQCLDNVSPPSLDRNYSAQASTRQRRLPDQYFNRSSPQCQKTMPSECLDNVSAPVFDRSSPKQASSRQRTIRREFICDESTPSFNKSSPQQISPRQITIPSQYLSDISAPTFDRSTPCRTSPLPRNLPRECLEDVSMPMYNSSATSAAAHPRQQRQQPRQLPTECLQDISPPSFDKSCSRPVYRQQRTLPSERLNDVSAPSFENSTSRQSPACQRTLPKECLNDVSMPVYASTPISTPRQRYQQPHRALPAPNRNQSENLCNVSPPSQLAGAGSTVGSQITDLVSCLNTMLESNFGVTLLPQMHSTTCQERIEDVTAPSFIDQCTSKLPPETDCNMYKGIMSEDCHCRLSDTNIEDISAPCDLVSMSNTEKLDDETFSTKSDEDSKSEKRKDTQKRNVKGFFSKKKDDASKKVVKDKTKTSESSDDGRLDGISPPVYPTPGSIKPFQNYQKFMEISKKLNEKPQQSPQTTGDESNLENVSAPNFASTPLSRNQTQLDEVTCPSYPSTPGSVQQFRNYQTAVDVTRKKIEKKLPQSRSQGRLKPATPASVQELRNYQSLIELVRRDEQEKNQAEKFEDNSTMNSTKIQDRSQKTVEDLTAPAFPPTPGSIQQLRNYEAIMAQKKSKPRNTSPPTSDSPDQSQNTKPSSSKKKDKSPDESPATSDNTGQRRNTKALFGKKKDKSQSPNNSDPADQAENAKTSRFKKRDKTPDAGPATSRGRSSSDPSNRSNQNLRNSRTQTAQSLANWWAESDRRHQRSASTPPQNYVPVYDCCNWCREVHYTSSPNFNCSNHMTSNANTTSNVCQNTTEYIYGCCLPCQQCQRYHRC